MADQRTEGSRTATRAEDPVLNKIVTRLVDTYHPERIYLFGSHGRGDSGPDSDYDLMVVVSDDAPPTASARRPCLRIALGVAHSRRCPRLDSRAVRLAPPSSRVAAVHRQARWKARLFRLTRLVSPIRARGWRAHDDLRGAEIDLAALPPLLGDVTFHCQQAVEKTLKGYLTWHDHGFRKTHDLTDLEGLASNSIHPSSRRSDAPPR